MEMRIDEGRTDEITPSVDLGGCRSLESPLDTDDRRPANPDVHCLGVVGTACAADDQIHSSLLCLAWRVQRKRWLYPLAWRSQVKGR